MFKKIIIGVAIVIGGLIIFATLKPAEFATSRELEILATPEALFPYVNNTKKSYEWMPWAEGDPGIKINFSGPDSGIGSTSSWNGKQMGIGKSEIVESIPNQLVKTRLTYTEPFEMAQLAEISLTPSTNGTLVKWSVSGDANFLFRFMGIFIDCDKMVGDQFMKGLGKLKKLAETGKE